ncbi:hypothetical protein PTTG_01416 [Puccinia triticina 1-1 BBBD Race 1]|uniref:NAM-associated domain-containing protein n=1 Tax=Puccinia triticina (isolate 1-1 / race 1 (BBBD)) TaxID=630390 RepID=A0A180H632_PUCT1|nr:hypothetical protein PTTG_01416 [Puccinia triticina 1-1 BBBD Race 1]
MPSSTHPNPLSTPTQTPTPKQSKKRKNTKAAAAPAKAEIGNDEAATKRKTTKAGAALPIEVDTDDAEPAPRPSKKPRKPIKKKAKDLVQEASDEDEKKVRAPNYKEDEDVQICRSWLEISKDPLNSTNQTATTFWARVREHYMTQIREHDCPIDSIKYRWQSIQRATNKFHGCFKQVTHANQSGTNNSDRLTAALKLDHSIEKRSYKHLQCYHVLSPSPKWLSYCEQLEQKKSEVPSDAKKTDFASDVSVPQSEAASDVTAIPTSDAREPIRPIGNKKAKDARAEEVKDTKWKQDLVKVQRDLANQSQAQIAILAEQKEAVIAMADESVMKVDPETIPEGRRAFFRWKQDKIMEKMQKEQQKKKKEEKKRKEEEEKRRRKKKRKRRGTKLKKKQKPINKSTRSKSQKKRLHKRRLLQQKPALFNQDQSNTRLNFRSILWMKAIKKIARGREKLNLKKKTVKEKRKKAKMKKMKNKKN